MTSALPSPPATGDDEPLGGGGATAVPHRTAGRALMLAALGIVFGDIGTSPLYALQTVFSIDNGAVRPTAGDVYGVVSMMFWSATLIVSIKYVGILMRADNDGEGGVMALTALVRRLYARRVAHTGLLVAVGILAVAGAVGVVAHPGVLKGLSPTYALLFVLDHPGIAFVAVGAVVLVVTGAE